MWSWIESLLRPERRRLTFPIAVHPHYPLACLMRIPGQLSSLFEFFLSIGPSPLPLSASSSAIKFSWTPKVLPSVNNDFSYPQRSLHTHLSNTEWSRFSSFSSQLKAYAGSPLYSYEVLSGRSLLLPLLSFINSQGVSGTQVMGLPVFPSPAVKTHVAGFPWSQSPPLWLGVVGTAWILQPYKASAMSVGTHWSA